MVNREGFGLVPELPKALGNEFIKSDPETVKTLMGGVSGILNKQPKGITHWLNVANTEGLPFVSYKMACEALTNLGEPVPEHLLARLGDKQ